ncbi:MAG: sporulation protein YunB [Clostridia bacterium]|nr:sporulation protein YunB [Clostridia bacterium]MDY4083698.1 sporulation protein YunB [Eubacteriales bacterium]
MRDCKSKNKNRTKRYLLIYVVLVVSVVVLSVYSFNVARNNLIDFVDEYTSANITAELVDGINNAVLKILSDNDAYQNYDNFIEISVGTDGNVSLINVNMLMVNLLLCDLTEKTQINVNNLCKEKIYNVPFYAITGSLMLAQLGKNIEIEVKPIGHVECKLSSKFDGVSVNQTRHSIFVDITARVKMILPLYVKDLYVSTKIVVAESVIVGKVPEMYLQNQDKLLTLN